MGSRWSSILHTLPGLTLSPQYPILWDTGLHQSRPWTQETPESSSRKEISTRLITLGNCPTYHAAGAGTTPMDLEFRFIYPSYSNPLPPSLSDTMKIRHSRLTFSMQETLSQILEESFSLCMLAIRSWDRKSLPLRLNDVRAKSFLHNSILPRIEFLSHPRYVHTVYTFPF